MRKLRFFGAVAVLALLAATFAALSMLPNTVSAKPRWVDCKNEIGEVGDIHFHGKNVYGTDGDDYIDCSASTKGVHIYGLGGKDTLIGGSGDDHLIGGDGNDTLYGGPGDDGLHGGYGKDMLNGGAGDDLCEGGPGTEDIFIDDDGNAFGDGIDDKAAAADCETYNGIP